MNIIEAPRLRHQTKDIPQLVVKDREDQWIDVNIPFVTQWIDAVRPRWIDPELFTALEQASHEAQLDGELIEHKYVRTQSIRRNTLDHTGLIPNLLDIADTRKEVLEILTDIVDRNVQSLKEEGIFKENNVRGFLAETPLGSWEFKGGETIEDYVNGAITADLLHGRIVNECKALRGSKSEKFYEKTKELFHQYQNRNGLELEYTPFYLPEKITPKILIKKLYYAKQRVHIFPTPHSSELDHLTPAVLRKEHEPLPDIKNPIWILHNSGKAGHPLAFVIAQSLKDIYHIPDHQAHHVIVNTEALNDWIRSRQ